MRAALYARVSTHDQQTVPLQLAAMREYVAKRGWKTVLEVQDVSSGASLRAKREELLKAARRRELDRIVVWRLDRWGRSLLDLIATLQELASVDVGFVSLSEALDLTTPSGRALAGMLAVFAEFERDILRDRVKAALLRRVRQVDLTAVLRPLQSMPRGSAHSPKKDLTKAPFHAVSASVGHLSAGFWPGLHRAQGFHRSGFQRH
jgi:DNA invertase Pin-like site-specific DNA recombinase